MIYCIKAAAILVLAVQILVADGLIELIPAVIVTVVLIMRYIPKKVLLRRNIFIISFSIVFITFAALSAYLSGSGIDHNITGMTAKILIFFNVMLAGTWWMGTRGLLNLAGSLPEGKLKIFIILLWKNVRYFYRLLPAIMNGIRSRMEIAGLSWIRIVRYYVVNLIIKELYGYRYLQASAVLRIGNTIPIRQEAKSVSVMDVCIFIAAAGGLTLTFYL